MTPEQIITWAFSAFVAVFAFGLCVGVLCVLSLAVRGTIQELRGKTRIFSEEEKP